MPDDKTDLTTLAARLDAVERALTDDDRDQPSNDASGTDTDTEAAEALSETTVADLEQSIAALDRRVSELSAELEAVRGLLGGVQAVNESVERRADLALAIAEQLAAAHDEDDGLVVERLPDDAETVGDVADRRDDTACDTDGDEAEDSLAARLREAL
ncbi:hypothetical protein C499_16112 [Halogeometricum borinquense DSM 11551]|uniref:DUF7310 domain-containing protein n=1 Tax=Halogeometricum borinquense (strain ATCC 700274 / DSM 11551 / JCM 10706 / KCTC 4070 / PR3) TaxID=469382 RepID=E4NRX9_HALBP|nr:hypothetical protein [Halogeometricum borinquense]ADQ68025.1 hypothetical protein Hbor_24670 [Halogeometricum borinquense DSM 11551]ELY24054.1 hypothetical protein C499_16112 [Halogeometricum borinquense DSM 11551]